MLCGEPDARTLKPWMKTSRSVFLMFIYAGRHAPSVSNHGEQLVQGKINRAKRMRFLGSSETPAYDLRHIPRDYTHDKITGPTGTMYVLLVHISTFYHI